MLEANELHRRFIKLMEEPTLIRNLTTYITEYQQNSVIVPASVNGYYPQNCYVASSLTQMIYYARDEIPKVESAPMRGLSYTLTYLLEWPLRWANIDNLQVLNNQCLSTNFYGNNWQSLDLAALRQQALLRHPKHALMLRSLNNTQHAAIIEKAQQDDWLPIVNRQVYLFLARETWWKRSNARTDDKLLTQPDWSFKALDHNNKEQMKQAETLYGQLYIDKHSQHNIDLTAQYLSAFSQAGVLMLFGLFYQDKLLGVAGLCGVDQTITVPVVGYDTNLPSSMALYRRIMAFVIRYAMDNKLILNLSSGSPDFKRLRGGRATIEYNYVYIKHLSPYQKTVWHGIAALSNKLYRPILEKFEL